jgi:hypothetical protein
MYRRDGTENQASVISVFELSPIQVPLEADRLRVWLGSNRGCARIPDSSRYRVAENTPLSALHLNVWQCAEIYRFRAALSRTLRT